MFWRDKILERPFVVSWIAWHVNLLRITRMFNARDDLLFNSLRRKTIAGRAGPQTKRALTEASAPLDALLAKEAGYIFFSEHTFFAASHVPPAFSQSAAFFAIVTSPAKAGPVKASAKANANVEIRVFMALLLTVVVGGSERTLFQRH